MNFSSHLRKNFKQHSVAIIVQICIMLKVFPSVCYLFSQFSQAGIVSQKGHKFSTYGLELAQPFLDTIFLLSRTGKKSNSHLEKRFSRQIQTIMYSNKILLISGLYLLSFLREGVHANKAKKKKNLHIVNEKT